VAFGWLDVEFPFNPFRFKDELVIVKCKGGEMRAKRKRREAARSKEKKEARPARPAKNWAKRRRLQRAIRCGRTVGPRAPWRA
jgi:hypothetical protein